LEKPTRKWKKLTEKGVNDTKTLFLKATIKKRRSGGRKENQKEKEAGGGKDAGAEGWPATGASTIGGKG